ncbi:cell division protein FtsQ/DivIB [Euzebya sp.]|uniref:cell division protein FtsQ/DivIB n=1 Tax=Euzebya sp. TaxID=1971409 RepID=UPI003514E0A2
MRTGPATTALRFLGLVGPARPAAAPAGAGRAAAGRATSGRGRGRRRGPARPARGVAPRPPRQGPARPLVWLGIAQAPVAIAGHPRIRERAIAHLRARRRRDDMITASLAILLGLVLVTIGVVRSPLLAVDEVALVGLDGSQQDVVAAQAGLAAGTNVLDVDLGAVASRVEDLPWVRRATAHRRLPSTVEVRVAVAEPVVRATVGETTFLLDGDGVVVESLPAGAAPGSAVTLDDAVDALPTVEVVTPPSVGSRVADPDLQAVAAVAAAMPTVVADWVVAYTGVGEGQVDAILHIPTEDGTVELVAHLGRAEDVSAKAATIAALVAETIGNGTTPQAFDVRIPDRPVVRT